jgi:hypothetical protein
VITSKHQTVLYVFQYCAGSKRGVRLKRTNGEQNRHVAGILVARHLKTPKDLGDSRPGPRTECLIALCHGPNRIMTRIDGVFGNSPGERKTMTTSFEETLMSVWRQSLVEACKTVTLEGAHYPVRSTSRSKLREVDFRFEEQRLRGLEQNPNTNSHWAQLAREGKKVMQFLSHGRYIANVVDGKLQFYGRRDRARSTTEQKSTTN